jgi:hypothetical protein
MFIVFGLVLNLNVYSQKVTEKIDTMMYVDLYIIGENGSVVMEGITKDFHISRLSKKTRKALIKSFYENCFYTPNILLYREVINKYLSLEDNGKNLMTHDDHQKYINFLQGNSREKRIVLDSGESVHINVTIITGKFVVFNKELINIPDITISYNIRELDNINQVCIPFRIKSYIKPSRKDMKKIFSRNEA